MIDTKVPLKQIRKEKLGCKIRACFAAQDKRRMPQKP